MNAEELARADLESQEVSRNLHAAARQIAALGSEATSQRRILESRVSGLYKLGRAGYARLLFNINDLRSVGRAYRTVSSVAALDRHRVAEHRRTLASLQGARAALAAQQERLAALAAEKQSAKAAIDQAVAARTAMLRSVAARQDLNAQYAAELRQAQARLQQSVAALARDGSGASAALPIGPFRGDLPWPLRGRVIGAFGPVRNAIPPRMRNGIEIGAIEAQSVRAVHDGRVAYADPFTGFGNVVIVDHGDEAYSLYGHLSTLSVQKGASVERGQLVGTAGHLPDGSPAVYFELRIDGKPVNPVQWLQR
jgi:septal ring factor EnvC (AmiA/AmiB activator)